MQDLDRHDPILDKFETIIQDITVYYTKKLDMLRIKSEQHQVSLEHPIRDIMVQLSQSYPNLQSLRKSGFVIFFFQFSKSNPYQVELIRILLEVYDGSVNKDELWQDMFCR